MTHTRPLHELAGLLPVRSATTDLPHYAEAEGAPAVCARQTGRRLTDAEAAAAPRFCSQCVKVAEKLVALDAESAEPASPLIDVARTFTDSVEFRQRNAEILTLAEAAGQVLVHGHYVLEPHYAAPGATSALCREDTVSRELDDEQSARVSIMCGECEKAARLRVERLVTEARQVADEAGARVRTNPDPEDFEWSAALDRMTVAVNYLMEHDPGYAAAADQAAARLAGELEAAEPRTTKGVAPSSSAHPDAVAALVVLAGMKAAPLTDAHDMTEPSDADLPVRGFAVEPRGHGLVAAYWLERGLARRRDDGWHGPALDAVRDRFVDAGWAVEPLRPSSLCVFAHRPQPTV